jgi:hypothetical protein
MYNKFKVLDKYIKYFKFDRLYIYDRLYPPSICTYNGTIIRYPKKKFNILEFLRYFSEKKEYKGLLEKLIDKYY